jgi:hypothetical protein
MIWLQRSWDIDHLTGETVTVQKATSATRRHSIRLQPSEPKHKARAAIFDVDELPNRQGAPFSFPMFHELVTGKTMHNPCP